MRYKICAPERDYTGKVGTVGFVDGVAYVDVDEDDPQHVNAPALRYFQAQGYTVEEHEGDPVHGAELVAENAALRAELEALRAQLGGGAPPAAPKKSATTDEWRAYAVSQGMTQDEANTKSRDDLVALYAPKEATQ